MDIKLTHSLLKDYLATSATPQQISDALSLCGPTVDHLHIKGQEHIYDIEIITNRVDSASAFGVAREAASILPQFGHAAKLQNNPYELTLKDLGDLPKNQALTIQILDQSLVARFACLSLKVKIGPSPKPTQQLLTNLGLRPINNVVDVTNELTARLGQPVHVFDLDKIHGGIMKLRLSRKGEKITTLDGHTHTLLGKDIVIEDGSGKLIDLCGIMGGQLSQVDNHTQNILLFVQTYAPKHIRHTSLYTQTRTLAAALFEKSPDPELVLPTIITGVQLLKQRADAQITSNLIDIYPSASWRTNSKKSLKLDLNWLNNFIGIQLPVAKVIAILNSLGFSTSPLDQNTLSCTAPTWRLNDINLREDLAEEIARVWGYFRLPSQLPPTVLSNTTTDPLLKHELTAKKYLAHLGFTEILNLSLVSETLFRKANLSLDHQFGGLDSAIKLNNPLSSDYEYLRTSLLPSLLFDLEQNRGKTELPIRIFELSNIYLSQKGQPLPNEISTLGLATQGLDFLTTKGYLEALAKKLHLSLTFQPLNIATSPFIQNQSAQVLFGNEVVGVLGQIDLQVLSNFQLTDNVILAQLNFQSLSSKVNSIHHFQKISEFPPIIEDINIISDQPIGQLLKELTSAHPLVHSVSYQSSYHNHHTFRLEFVSQKKNLSQKEVDQLKEQILLLFRT